MADLVSQLCAIKFVGVVHHRVYHFWLPSLEL